MRVILRDDVAISAGHPQASAGRWQGDDGRPRKVLDWRAPAVVYAAVVASAADRRLVTEDSGYSRGQGMVT